MSSSIQSGTARLLRKGATILLPETVEISDDVDLDLVAPDITIHPGCRIRGSATVIGAGSVLGEEQPLTLQDCQLGCGVRLKGGFVSGSTFLDNSSMGSGAHVRPGSLIEEEASGAHSVGLKQTILLPFVTLGSLINFCDALMAGGTSRKNHSEVGSSYIHFNFTPHQDKATPSLVGDVPHGVMLNQPPIFLGGQGGLVGPVRLGFGTVVPAGVVCRRDALDSGQIVFGVPLPTTGAIPYDAGVYKDVTRVIRNNLIYLGNLQALQAWYDHARPLGTGAHPIQVACIEGARQRLVECMNERVRRLDQFQKNVQSSVEILVARGESDLSPFLVSQRGFITAWPGMKEQVLTPLPDDFEAGNRDAVLQALSSGESPSYWPDRIAALSPEVQKAGNTWLQGIVDRASDLWHP